VPKQRRRVVVSVCVVQGSRIRFPMISVTKVNKFIKLI